MANAVPRPVKARPPKVIIQACPVGLNGAGSSAGWARPASTAVPQIASGTPYRARLVAPVTGRHEQEPARQSRAAQQSDRQYGAGERREHGDVEAGPFEDAAQTGGGALIEGGVPFGGGHAERRAAESQTNFTVAHGTTPSSTR